MDERLYAYLQICRRTYERHMREGTWPWTDDSTNPKDMVESDSHNDEI